ncbi:hypothetical protein Tco_1543812 [Tanacetum coccineum]
MAALQYKDDHNKIAYLGRETGSEDFTDILSYLDHSPLRYALTHDPPVVFDSLVKQFWATATVRPNAAGSHDLVATIDGREVVVTESLIRAQLQLDDANGIFDMQIDDIFAGMGAIGYPPVDMVINPPWTLPFLGAKGLTSPEQTATGKGISNPLMAVMVCPKPYGIQLTNVSSTENWKLLLRDVAASFDSAVHRVHAGSFDAAVASLVSAAYIFVSADSIPADYVSVPAGRSSSIPADYVSAGRVLVPADSDRIC